jgi:6-phosphogluconate dehydrogenase
MRIGMIGLGKMGGNMARRLLRGGHEVVVFDVSKENIDALSAEGAKAAYTMESLVEQLRPPRAVWLMLPAGKPVADTVLKLEGLLGSGDTVIEGGNSYFKDAIEQESRLRRSGIFLIDAGVSSGIWGLEKGYCLMLGGEKAAYEPLVPVFKALAPEGGFMHCGPSGAGHFVKMVHNGMEYALMAAYGEGFEIMEASPYGQHIDYAQLSKLWNSGSIIRSWLLEFAQSAFSKYGKLEGIEGYVQDSGEGRWTVQQAVDTGVPAPVISAALFQRFRSRQADSFSDKLLAAMRDEFGGHGFKKKAGD